MLKMLGTVDWYDNSKGKRYGVIRGDDGQSYFVRYSNLAQELDELRERERVVFRSGNRSRTGKSGKEAFEVRIAAFPDEVAVLKDSLGAVEERCNAREVILDAIVIAKWCPEMKEDVLGISRSFELALLPTTRGIVRHVDPFAREYTEGPHKGAYEGHVRWKNESAGIHFGSYITMGDAEHTLLLFTFMRPGYKKQGKDVCWRAYLIRDRDGKIIYMPPKDDGSFNSYRQGSHGFRLLMSDLHDMLRRVLL